MPRRRRRRRGQEEGAEGLPADPVAGAAFGATAPHEPPQRTPSPNGSGALGLRLLEQHEQLRTDAAALAGHAAADWERASQQAAELRTREQGVQRGLSALGSSLEALRVAWGLWAERAHGLGKRLGGLTELNSELSALEEGLRDVRRRQQQGDEEADTDSGTPGGAVSLGEGWPSSSAVRWWWRPGRPDQQQQQQQQQQHRSSCSATSGGSGGGAEAWELCGGQLAMTLERTWQGWYSAKQLDEVAGSGGRSSGPRVHWQAPGVADGDEGAAAAAAERYTFCIDVSEMALWNTLTPHRRRMLRREVAAEPGEALGGGGGGGSGDGGGPQLSVAELCLRDDARQALRALLPQLHVGGNEADGGGGGDGGSLYPPDHAPASDGRRHSRGHRDVAAAAAGEAALLGAMLQLRRSWGGPGGGSSWRAHVVSGDGTAGALAALEHALHAVHRPPPPPPPPAAASSSSSSSSSSSHSRAGSAS
eukprot:COSAG01_NODE_495_length_16308_cov_92.317088_7_plen_477_part_00